MKEFFRKNKYIRRGGSSVDLSIEDGKKEKEEIYKNSMIHSFYVARNVNGRLTEDKKEVNKKMDSIISRCGNCGIWLLNGDILQPTYFLNMRIAELEKSGKYDLDYCSDCANEHSQQKGYVTRDMAIDAQDLSLEGQPVY